MQGMAYAYFYAYAPEEVDMSALRRLARKVAAVVKKGPSLIAFISDPDIGRDHGIGPLRKLRLVATFWRNIRCVPTLSSLVEHVELAAAVLRVPRSVRGDVIECGCYVGGSSVNLSLACALAGRRLLICDSFQGLPEPAEEDRVHHVVHTGHADEYYEGRFAASLETVKGNLAKYGSLEVCDFAVGFFEETLPDLQRDVVVAFLDVDLVDSLKPCLQGIWPNLQDDCKVYVHEADSLRLVSVFFDAGWWKSQIGDAAPGFVGSGTGLPLAGIDGSVLGYAQKGAAALIAVES